MEDGHFHRAENGVAIYRGRPMMLQQELFPAPVAQVAFMSARDRHKARFDAAFSLAIREQILAVFAAKPTQWLQWRDFRPIIDEHQIGFCFGHVLDRAVRDGLILERKIYWGSEHPGPDYQGYCCQWGSLSTPGPFVEVKRI